MHISACKYQNNETKVDSFIKSVEHIVSIEQYITVKNDKLNMLNPKWFIDAIDPQVNYLKTSVSIYTLINVVNRT